MLKPYTTTSFPGENIEYIIPTWDYLSELAFTISCQIVSKNKKYDRIVTLAKGGWPLTKTLVDFLQVKEVASMGVKFYSGINQRLSKPEIYQELPVSVVGEKVLLYDDVADTGESFLFAIDYLKSLGVEEINTASLFLKPHSRYAPDYYGAQTSAWIIFPHDIRETVISLGNKWKALGLESSEIDQRFDKLGFNPAWVSQFQSWQ